MSDVIFNPELTEGEWFTPIDELLDDRGWDVSDQAWAMWRSKPWKSFFTLDRRKMLLMVSLFREIEPLIIHPEARELLRVAELYADDESLKPLMVQADEVVYDLWDEVYRIRVSGPGEERNLAVLTIDGVLRQCADVKDLPLGDRQVLVPGRPHFLGVIVDVNPVSPQMLEQMRRWVSRPAGSTGIGPGDALFGSFVGLFVRQIGTSDRTLRFKTQLVTP